MRKYLLAVAAGLVLIVAIQAQSNYVAPGSSMRTWIGVMPSTAVNVCSGSCFVVSAVASTGGSSGTITMTDGATDCSGPCNFANAVAIAANTTYAIPLAGTFSPNGINVSATGTVHLHFLWSTQPPAGWVR